MAPLHCWSGWWGMGILPSHSACWRSLGANQTRASREWPTWPAGSEKQISLSTELLKIAHTHIGCWSAEEMQETRRHCLLWTCSGHQMCALSLDSSAPGWLSDESPWTPAELYWPPWAAAQPGSGSYRNHLSASNPAGGLREGRGGRRDQDWLISL